MKNDKPVSGLSIGCTFLNQLVLAILHARDGIPRPQSAPCLSAFTFTRSTTSTGLPRGIIYNISSDLDPHHACK
jgi:hypothetical protein